MVEEKVEKKFPEDYVSVDVSGALLELRKFPEQIKEGYALAADIVPQRPFSKIVIAGMGGSGIAGDLLKSYLTQTATKPLMIEVAKGYDAPPIVDEDTLLFAISYSGNTEETLATYKMAVRKGCQVVVMSSGGKAKELAALHRHDFVQVPKGKQPRMALGYLFFPLIKIMENAGVLPPQKALVDELVARLRKQNLHPAAINLSEKLVQTVPLIWSDQTIGAVAYRWRTQFNENAKTLAFDHVFSEINHNEVLSFTNRPAKVHVIILSSDADHRRIIKRIALTKEILQKKGVAVTEIGLKGSLLERMCVAIHLGDLTSYYLALRYEIDPTPVKIIETFKKDMGPFLI